LEPIFLIIVWLGVVFVSLAVISPIYNLVWGLNKQTSTENTSPNRNIVKSNVVLQKTVATTTDEIEDIGKIIPKIKIISSISSLNIRAGNSFDYNIIGRAGPNQIYEYVQELDNWYKIVLGEDKTGWVYGDYVNIINNDAE
jgi:uncharacterized protein YgiM (DUF1202 family)